MSTQVIMPQLGESVVEGTVGKWLVAEGQPVKEYDPLLQVTTDKVDTEIPAPASGILLKIYVPEGQTVAKGTVLAEIGEQGLGIGGLGIRGLDVPHADAVVWHQQVDSQGSSPQSLIPNTQSPISATPVAHRIAAAYGLDLSEVTGTGPGGRITKEDVEAHLASEADIPNTAIPNPQSPISGLGFISPAVARLASELGVDLSQVIGTGAGGRITKKDVLAYVAAPVPREGGMAPGGLLTGVEALPAWEQPGTGSLFKPSDEVEPASWGVGRGSPTCNPQDKKSGPARPLPRPPFLVLPSEPLEAEVVPLSAMRRNIARHMALSVQTSPHVTTVMEADMTRIVGARERLRGGFERQGVKLTFTPFFVQAIVAGLKAVPEANSSLRDDALLLHRHVHIGVAVAMADGLIVPVVRDADEKSLLGLARAINDLAERARTKQLKPDEVQGGTFTLTNHGTSGSLFATPIINQPQAGILGVGAIQKRAVVVSRGHPLLPDPEDAIAIRPMVYLSFTFDHRILDGQGADGFLRVVKRFLEGYSV